MYVTSHFAWGENYFESLYRNMMEAQGTLKEVLDIVKTGMKTLSDSVKSVENFIDSAMEEDCVYKCIGSGEKIALPNPEHIAKANGCGSLGVFFGEEDLSRPEMVHCCDDHDICYDTCGTEKENCDRRFKRCLYSTCEVNRKEMNNLAYKKCRGGAKLLYIATITVGCASFKEAQDNACVCVDVRDVPHKKDEL